MEKDFGKFIEQLRGKMSLRDAAEKSGLSHTYIRDIERGFNRSTKAPVKPSPETLQRLANAYSYPYEELMRRAGYWSQHEELGVILPIGEVVQIPIVAEIPCGMPAVTEDNVIGYFPVDSSQTNLNGADWVFVKAKGDSMIGVGIRDGSLVLLRLQPEVEDRDIAAVCIDNERATLKRVFFAGNQVILMPENPAMSPFTYDRDRVRIVGKAIKVINDL